MHHGPQQEITAQAKTVTNMGLKANRLNESISR